MNLLVVTVADAPVGCLFVTDDPHPLDACNALQATFEHTCPEAHEQILRAIGEVTGVFYERPLDLIRYVAEVGSPTYLQLVEFFRPGGQQAGQVAWRIIKQGELPEGMSGAIQALLRKLDRYFDLVWYARRGPDARPPAGRRGAAVIEAIYPDDVAALDEHPDWQHGFNSGVLATLRWVLATLEDGHHQRASKEFPFLDT